MSLYDFFFPEQAQAEHLHRIAREQERANRIRINETEQGHYQSQELEGKVRQLEYDIGTLSLILAAILKKLDEKGQVTREEVKEVIEKIDLIDRVQDGRISVEDLRSGKFF